MSGTALEWKIMTIKLAGIDGGGSYPRHIAAVDFDLADAKRRRVGCLLIVEEERSGFTSRIQSTRDGRKYGATNTFNQKHLTLDEAKASVIERAEKSRQVATRKFQAKSRAPKRAAHPAEDLPACARDMGCLCAGHARGAPASEPCDATE